jgi:spore maturation protein CgeB
VKLALFYHSLLSDWNHGNAHFLRGITAELLARGHDVTVYECRDAWSVQQLARREGAEALAALGRRYPHLQSIRYGLETLDLDAVLDGVDVVVVHEWSPLELVTRLAEHRHRTRDPYVLLFHDTHHRAVSAPEQLDEYSLGAFDGALVFGETLAGVYRAQRWVQRVWVWHEAADLRICHLPPDATVPEHDVIWIGNWGDGERTRELDRYLFTPVRRLRASGSVYGVRYPPLGRWKLWRAGLAYCGWIANFETPPAYHRHRLTVHVPRRLYAETLAGIPTIRIFEALANGAALISAPWRDSEGLFEVGKDFLMVRDGAEMTEAMRDLLGDEERRRALAAHGRRTIESRHTCAHRVDQLLDICAELRCAPRAATATA